MRIGIVLPATEVGAASRVVRMAAHAEELGFATVAVTDRVAYAAFDPIAMLGAAAAVTRRVELMTSVLLGPIRSTAVMARQLATIDDLSEGRLTVGLGVGSRPDDYGAVGVPFSGRGRTLDDQLDALRSDSALRSDITWLIGGGSDATIERVVARADGWIAGPGGPTAFAATAATLDDAWRASGREGRPRRVAMVYCALGPDRDHAIRSLVEYYRFLGPSVAERIGAGVCVEPGRLASVIDRFAAIGCDDVLVAPCSSVDGELERARGAIAYFDVDVINA